MSRDKESVLDMLQAATRAAEAVEGFSFEEFEADWKAQSLVQHQLMILGEAVKRLSPEFRQRYKQFPWSAIAGHRDILIHQYNDVDIHEVWRIAVEELPDLINFLQSIVPEKE
jgi:uncharacterized protein with HEPN domain